MNYLYSFGEICPKDLPDDKVKIMVTVCDDWDTTTIKYPFAPWMNSSSSTCVKWVQRFTGIYADPRFYRLRASTVMSADLKMFEDGLKDPSNFMRSLLGQDPAHTSTRDDAIRVIQTNGCKSTDLKTFSENLLRFIGGGRSLQAEAGEPPFWEAECGRSLPAILAGVSPQACKCLHPLLNSTMTADEMFALEDGFTRELFLTTAVSKVGLREKVASCLQ